MVVFIAVAIVGLVLFGLFKATPVLTEKICDTKQEDDIKRLEELKKELEVEEKILNELMAEEHRRKRLSVNLGKYFIKDDSSIYTDEFLDMHDEMLRRKVNKENDSDFEDFVLFNMISEMNEDLRKD